MSLILGNRDDLVAIRLATHNVYNTPGISTNTLQAIELVEVALHIYFDHIKQSIHRYWGLTGRLKNTGVSTTFVLY